MRIQHPHNLCQRVLLSPLPLAFSLVGLAQFRARRVHLANHFRQRVAHFRHALLAAFCERVDTLSLGVYAALAFATLAQPGGDDHVVNAAFKYVEQILEFALSPLHSK